MISVNEIKEQIIEGLNLEDLSVDEIENDMALFDEGLGLDSVDAIELVMVFNNKYGVKFDNKDEFKNIFSTVQTLTDYVNAYLKK